VVECVGEFAGIVGIDEFVSEWKERAFNYNGNFKCVWKDTVTGELIDFSLIGDVSELFRASEKAELQYMGMLMEERARFVKGGGKGIDFDRELCKNDLYYLCKHVLGFEDMVFHLHFFMCMSVVGIPRGYYGLREFPRGSFKSTIFGIGWAIQLIISDPNIKILYLSSKDGNASRKLQEIVKQFKGNVILGRLFPDCVPRTNAELGSGSKWDCPDKRNISLKGESTIMAAGITSSLASIHVDVILADDIWDEKSVASPDVLAKCKSNINKIDFLFNRASKYRYMMVIDTRYSFDDPTEMLIKKDGYECLVVSGILPNGRSLFPEQFSLGWMKDYCSGDAEGGSLFDFSCQIMLNPSDGDSGFKEEWFRYLTWDEILVQVHNNDISIRKVVLVDATVDSKKESDYIAIEVWVIDSLGRKTLVEYVREKMAPSDFINRVEVVWDKWTPDFIVRQKSPLETTLMSFFRELNKNRVRSGKSKVKFYDYSLRKREKKQRITASLQPRYQQGSMYHDIHAGNIKEFEKELKEHPHSMNDDGIDAASMLDDVVVSRIPAAPFVLPVVVEEDISDYRVDKNGFKSDIVKNGFSYRRSKDQSVNDYV
jgi:phage terminase large subunit-like protein